MSVQRAGRAGPRVPVVAYAVGLALMVLAHVVACGFHGSDTRDQRGPFAAQTPAAMSAAHSRDILGQHDPASPLAEVGHLGHAAECCTSAERPADVRAAGSYLLPSLLLLAVRLPGRHGCTGDGAEPGAPPGAGPPPPFQLPVFRLVCVSRT